MPNPPVPRPDVEGIEARAKICPRESAASYRLINTDIYALLAYIGRLEQQREMALHHLQADGALDRRLLCDFLARDMKALAALRDES